MSRKSKELRKGERFTDAHYNRYTTTIGQFVLSWNDLHEKLALVFAGVLSHADRRKIPKKHKVDYEFRERERLAGIWNSSQHDRPKREMLRGIMVPLVVADLIEFSDLEEDIRWILDQADKVEDFRNNAVHSPLIHAAVEYDITPMTWLLGRPRKKHDIAPNILMQNRRALRIAQKKANDEFGELRWARDASIVLRDFALRIYWALLYEHAPWPRRPSLPNLGRRKSRPNRRRPAPAR